MGQAFGVLRRAWLASTVVALVATVLCSGAPCSAAIDATGTWEIGTFDPFGNPYTFTEQWVQNGSTLTIDGFVGTIDPNTGVFSVTLTPNPFCAPDYLAGTVAADGLTLTGIYTAFLTFNFCGFRSSAIGIHIPAGCGDGIVGPTEGCDDGNLTPGDGCSLQCVQEPCWSCTGEPSVCTPLPSGSPCPDDGDACTTNACNGVGFCGASPVDCDDGHLCTVDSCDPQGGCVHQPDLRSCQSGEKTKLLSVDAADDMHDTLQWKLTKGASATQADFGTPTTATSETLCVFGGTANALIFEADVLADAQKWRPKGTRGFRYQDDTGSAAGIHKVILNGSANHRSKIIVQGQGAALGVSPPLQTPVTVQLFNDTTNVCWSATYDGSDVQHNTPGRFKAETTGP